MMDIFIKLNVISSVRFPVQWAMTSVGTVSWRGVVQKTNGQRMNAKKCARVINNVSVRMRLWIVVIYKASVKEENILIQTAMMSVG
jgi:hypothetical protein